MRKGKEATTMSVPEMARLLGIRKTDSYWLVHKNCFETAMVAGKMRINKASFEKWYAKQTHYRKVTGEEPGQKVREQTYTIAEIAEMLGICKDCVIAALRKNDIRMITICNQFRVSRKEFDAWYASQTRYRNQQDRERDKALEEASLTVPEIARLLSIEPRYAWYHIALNPQNKLESIRVADRTRIMRDSFEAWYQNQSEYRKPDDASPEQKYEIAMETLKKTCDSGTVSMQDACSILGIDEHKLYRQIQYGELPSRKFGKRIFIMTDDLIYWARQNKEMIIGLEE